MNSFSLTIADELFAAFPEWRAFAREEPADDGSRYLVVEVTPPREANVEHGLVIDTSNDEVTVGFDCYHAHFASWVGDGERFGAEAALEFIKQLLSERVVVVSWWFNEKWRGSTQAEANAPAVPPWGSNFNRVRVRSWSGLLNADSTE